MADTPDTFTIARLGHRGDGIADGPLFAPLTLPGEKITGTPEGNRLTDIRIVTPSSDRVSPPCRHFKACGGCQLQHASDDFVARWKREVVEAALTANGLSAPFRETFTSAPLSRRRAVFSARRTKKGALAGFHARASDAIVEIPDCRLLEPALHATLPIVEELARLGASRRGEMSVTVTTSKSGADIAVVGGHEPDGPLLIELAATAQKHDLARLTWNGEVIAARKPAAQSFGKVQVVPPPGAFLQATKSGEAALRDGVMEAVKGARKIVDLFAGCGTFSLPLAETGEVHAVEGSREMMKALDHGWRHSEGLRRVTCETRDLFRRPLLAEELARYDACVIDPPRAGAEAQIAELARSGIARIAHVSCNPVTFARDAKTLAAAGYGIDWVKVVDQFRWSSHVELIASFSLKTP